MIAGYKKHGKAYFIHGNRNRKPSSSLSPEDKKKIIDLYLDPLYSGANFTHFHELIMDKEDIPKVSLSTLRNIFKEADILSPKAHRHTKREFNKRLKSKENTPHSAYQDSLLVPIDTDPHPRREKSKFSGELIFMDASQHDWLETGEKIHLHAAIDDKTSTVIGAYFCKEETLEGYYRVLEMILKDYGIPAAFQTDGRTIFEYAAFSRPRMKEDTYTQFSYACKTLGIALRTTSSAQAQGKVERLFGTLQSRLIVDMRLEGIKTIKEANKFLYRYLSKHNKKFATSQPNHTPNVFEDKPSKEEINLTLATLDTRVIDQGNSIGFMNNYYRLLDKESQPIYLRPGTRVMVIKALDGGLYASVKESVFLLDRIRDYKECSLEFDPVKIVQKKRKVSIPQMTHPWKEEKFLSHKKAIWSDHYNFDWKDIYSTEDIWYTQEGVFT